MNRTFKISIGANLKLLKKIDEKLEKVVKELDMINEIPIPIDEDGLELAAKNGKLDFALELQENIKQWKRDIGYEEGLKELSKIDELFK